MQTKQTVTAAPKPAAAGQAPGFWVRQNFLSDGSAVYDVMFNAEEVYAALSEMDAHDQMVKLRDVVGMTSVKQCEDRRWMAKPLYQRLNMMSHGFGFDSPQARTLTEAAQIAKSAVDLGIAKTQQYFAGMEVGKAERDALRAEVETLRSALQAMDDSTRTYGFQRVQQAAVEQMRAALAPQAATVKA